ncbi:MULTISPECIES: hydantoinase B/oxoprolinase family protein [Chelativorans]|uniref:hydantoinase B/oxoprolinase family protein n=1 Tax=Chelativorans multitrophicus TaxID=449973 RepID=UPI0012EDAC21
MNSSYANTRAAVVVAFIYFCGADEGLNDGSARCIELRTRKGSICDFPQIARRRWGRLFLRFIANLPFCAIFPETTTAELSRSAFLTFRS